MAYRDRNEIGRGDRNEEFRNRGSQDSEGYPRENFGQRSGRERFRDTFGASESNFASGVYGQHGGYSEEGGYDPQRRQGLQPEGYRRYGESYGRGPEGFDRESGSYGGYGSGFGQQPGGTRGYGSEFGRSTSEFGGTGYGDFARESTRGRFTGRGPKGYVRSDERIKEDVSDRLEQHGEIDASEIEVQVSHGEVTLEGTVEDRRTKRLAEDIIETCPGVKQVHNRIRVQGNGAERAKSQSTSNVGTSSRTSTRS
jgi:BON domain